MKHNSINIPQRLFLPNTFYYKSKFRHVYSDYESLMPTGFSLRIDQITVFPGIKTLTSRKCFQFSLTKKKKSNL